MTHSQVFVRGAVESSRATWTAPKSLHTKKKDGDTQQISELASIERVHCAEMACAKNCLLTQHQCNANGIFFSQESNHP